MTNQELFTQLGSDSKWNKARKIFSGYSAQIEQAGMQRDRISPVEIRKLELEAIEKICEIYGIDPRSA